MFAYLQLVFDSLFLMKLDLLIPHNKVFHFLFMNDLLENSPGLANLVFLKNLVLTKFC